MLELLKLNFNDVLIHRLPPASSEPEEAKPALPPKKVRLNSKTPSSPPLSPKLEEFIPEFETTNSEAVELNNELEKPCINNISNELKHQEKEEVVLRRKSKVKKICTACLSR